MTLEGHLRASLAGAALPLTRKPLSKAWAGCVLFSKITTIGAWPCTMLFVVSNQVFLIEFDHTVHIPKLWLGISNIFNLGKAAGFATYPARPGNLLVAVWSVILQILEVKCRAIFESAGHVCTMHWRLMQKIAPSALKHFAMMSYQLNIQIPLAIAQAHHRRFPAEQPSLTSCDLWRTVVGPNKGRSWNNLV